MTLTDIESVAYVVKIQITPWIKHCSVFLSVTWCTVRQFEYTCSEWPQPSKINLPHMCRVFTYKTVLKISEIISFFKP